MNVLHVSTTDGAGGAARGARRLHDALPGAGVGSAMVAAHVDYGGEAVELITSAPGRPLAPALAIERAMPKLSRFTGELAFPFPSSHLLRRSRAFAEADVIHLHNLHGSYFDIRALRGIAAERPLVWTLHDMWPLTGHCAYSYDCERWRSPTGCGPCPLFEPANRPLDDIPQPPWDNSASGWRRKRGLYSRIRFDVTAPSRWLLGNARESLFALNPRTRFHHVPYGLDTEVLRPVPRGEARERLRIAPEAEVVIFAAAALAQERKGLRHVMAAFARPELAERGAVLLTFGSAGGLDDALPGLRELGEIDDEAAQSVAYSAADLAVVPSLADNQPLVALEALACGVPVVATDVGGLPEIVREGETGICVPPEAPEPLAAAIAALLDDDEERLRLGEGAREHAVAVHGAAAHARAFAEIYAEAASAPRGGNGSASG